VVWRRDAIFRRYTIANLVALVSAALTFVLLFKLLFAGWEGLLFALFPLFLLCMSFLWTSGLKTRPEAILAMDHLPAWPEKVQGREEVF
jgi:4'-phosphopantetheinyl transferase EntD